MGRKVRCRVNVSCDSELLLFFSAPVVLLTPPHVLHLHNSIQPFPYSPLLKLLVFITFFIFSRSFSILYSPSTSLFPFSCTLLFSPPCSPPLSLRPPSRLSIRQYFSSQQIASLLYCCTKLTVCLSSPWALNTLNQRLKEIDILPPR